MLVFFQDFGVKTSKSWKKDMDNIFIPSKKIFPSSRRKRRQRQPPLPRQRGHQPRRPTPQRQPYPRGRTRRRRS